MMDLLLVQQYSVSQIQSFLSEVFDCSVERVKIFSVGAFNSLDGELDDLTFDCVCIFSQARGDVAQLLQLYRYKLSDSDALRRTVEIALQRKVRCYLPSDSLNAWIYVNDGDAPKYAQRVEGDEENCFVFKLK